MTFMRVSLVAFGALALTAGALALPFTGDPPAQAQQVKLAKGKTWWGKVGDAVELEFKDGLSIRKVSGTVTKIEGGIITLEGTFDGRKATRPIYASEIQSIRPLDGSSEPAKETEAPAAPKTTPSGKDAAPKLTPRDLPAPGSLSPFDTKIRGSKGYGNEKEMPINDGTIVGKDSEGYPISAQGYRVAPKKGAFLLPFHDGVGQTARAFEIEQMAAHADKWGPGQIIVLDIDSPGGLVVEIYRISETLKEVRKRHRVVAWIKKAISAASATAVHCDEIYFRTVGSLGACMMITGRDSAPEPMVRQFILDMDKVVAAAGRDPAVFRAMVYAEPILTYTKDPVTGKPTMHDKITGLPGEVILSDEKDNLVFNASNAVDSGFSQGIADNEEELAKLLGLPEWYEISKYGRTIAANWKKTYEDCENEMPALFARMNMRKAGGTLEELQRDVQVLETILKWTKRCRPCTDGIGIDPDAVERFLKETQQNLAAARKASRGNRSS